MSKVGYFRNLRIWSKMVWEFEDSKIWTSTCGSKRVDGTYNSEYFGTDSGHYLVSTLLFEELFLNFKLFSKNNSFPNSHSKINFYSVGSIYHQQ